MHLGLIGYGNIAATLLGLLGRPGGGARPQALTVLVRPGRAEAQGADIRRAHAPLGGPLGIVERVEDLIAARPSLVIECAGHGGVAAHVPQVLEQGIDVVLVSIGALAEDALEERLRAAAAEGGARFVLTPGAVGGIDLLSALSAAGGLDLTYRGTKPPGAWAGTPAEAVCDLAALDAPATIFSGTAREAARAFPKNANVAATLALAGPGFEATRVELIADPAARGNGHAYEVRSPLATYRVEIESQPSPGNAKTSLSTVYAVLREIRNRMSPVVI